MACGKINALIMRENSFSHYQSICHSLDELVISITKKLSKHFAYTVALISMIPAYGQFFHVFCLVDKSKFYKFVKTKNSKIKRPLIFKSCTINVISLNKKKFFNNSVIHNSFKHQHHVACEDLNLKLLW